MDSTPLALRRPALRRRRALVGALLLTLIAALALPSWSTAAPAARLSVSGLTTEDLTNPLGIDVAVPRFGWIVEANYNGAEQTAYEIRVSSHDSREGDVWSSGRVESADSFDVEYAGPPLESQTRYYWAVRVWSDRADGPSQWSKRAWFET